MPTAIMPIGRDTDSRYADSRYADSRYADAGTLIGRKTNSGPGAT